MFSFEHGNITNTAPLLSHKLTAADPNERGTNSDGRKLKRRALLLFGIAWKNIPRVNFWREKNKYISRIKGYEFYFF